MGFLKKVWNIHKQVGGALLNPVKAARNEGPFGINRKDASHAYGMDARQFDSEIQASQTDYRRAKQLYDATVAIAKSHDPLHGTDADYANQVERSRLALEAAGQHMKQQEGARAQAQTASQQTASRPYQMQSGRPVSPDVMPPRRSF